MQIKRARLTEVERQHKAAVTIQRAFRQHRVWKLSYGAANVEFRSEQVPEPLPVPALPALAYIRAYQAAAAPVTAPVTAPPTHWLGWLR